jgi:hypothetical protein
MIAESAFALSLIALHAPNGQLIEINPDHVSSLRSISDLAVKGKHFPPATHCIIVMTNGNFNAVAETCEQVDKILTHSEGREQ